MNGRLLRAHDNAQSLKPGGRFTAPDMFRAGGMRLLGKHLKEGGLIQDGLTTSGKNLFEEIADAKETPGQQVIHTLAKPHKKDGGLAILRGSLAPDGCVVKLSGHERIFHTGPARVFDSEEAAFGAVLEQKIKPGDVVVIRYEGPKGGPGMQEMLAVTGALVGQGISGSIALRACSSYAERVRLEAISTIFCEPMRQGTHLPQDSLRKNRVAVKAWSNMFTPEDWA